MAKTTGAETPTPPAVTAPAEPVAPAAAEPVQDNNLAKELEEARASLAALQAAQEKLTKEKNDAIANSLRYDAMYKGLQNQTTKSLQKAAEDRRALAEARMQAAEVADIKSLLSTLAEKVLDEDEAKNLKYKQKELELQRREEAMKAAATQTVEEPVVNPQPYTNPEDEKAQFLSYYFPGVEVDPNDPNIDWGVGANSTQEAFRRFTTSVLKIKDQKESTKANDAVSELRRQAEEQLAALKKQQEELATKTAEEIAAATAAAEEKARKEAEKRLRALGADVSGTPTSDGAGRKTFAQQLEEELPDSLLQTKKGQEEYARRFEAMKKQFQSNFNK